MIDFERMNLIQPDGDWMLEHGFGLPVFAPGYAAADDGGRYFIGKHRAPAEYQLGGPVRIFSGCGPLIIAAIGELDGLIWRFDLRYGRPGCRSKGDRFAAAPKYWDEFHEIWVDHARWFDLMTDALALVRLNAWIDGLGFPRSTDNRSPWYGRVKEYRDALP